MPVRLAGVRVQDARCASTPRRPANALLPPALSHGRDPHGTPIAPVPRHALDRERSDTDQTAPARRSVETAALMTKTHSSPTPSKCHRTVIVLALGTGLLCLGSVAPVRAQDEPARLLRTESGGLGSRCARCHDRDGTGNAARDNLGEIPNFRNHKWQTSRSDTQLLVSILDGKGKHMPSFRGKLSDGEAREIVAQIRALDSEQAEPPREPSAADFETRFNELQRELEELKNQLRALTRGHGNR